MQTDAESDEKMQCGMRTYSNNVEMQWKLTGLSGLL